MKFFMNLTIKTKLILTFGALMVFMILLTLLAVTQINLVTMEYERHLVKNHVTRQTYVSNAIRDMNSMRFANLSKGYLMERKELESHLAELYGNYQRNAEAFVKDLEEYCESIANELDYTFAEKVNHTNLANEILWIFNEEYIPIIDEINAGMANGDSDGVFTTITNTIPVGNKLTNRLNELREITLNTLEKKAAEIAADTAASKNMMYILAVAFILFLSGFILLLAYSIRTPIKQIEEAASEISSGNLSYPIRMDRSDELGILSNSIGDMVDKISELNKTVSVMDYLDSMICIITLDYRLVYVNQRFADAYGLDKATCLTQRCYEIARHKDSPCASCRLSKLLPDKDAYPTHEYTNEYDKELNVWVSGKAAIIRWVDGSLVYFHTFTDQTLKMEYETQLKAAAEAAEAMSTAKSTFLANMSHEIRTPLNSIIGFSELALDGSGQDGSKDYLLKILENSDWLLEIINDILDISKIEHGKLEIENAPFDLDEVFSFCESVMQPKAAEKGVNMQFYAEPFVGNRLMGDSVRLRQVLLNFLSNAVKFTDEGTIKLSSDIVSATEDSCAVYFEIKDSGIGMTPGQLKRIFEPFYQAEAGTTRKHGGTGLGLPITKNIIESMGGELSVESAPGIGSKFSFQIEFDTVKNESAEAKDSSKTDEIEKPLFTGIVLLCEDNHMNQQMICEHLTRVGLTPEVAKNGKIGVDMVKERKDKGMKPYDLILMDMFMPVMDGLEAAGLIMGMETGAPIVAVTANIMPIDKETYAASGMNDCLGKPFTTQELWHLLVKYLPPQNKVSASEEEKRRDEVLLRTLTKQFVDNYAGRFSEFTDALELGDIKLAHRFVHNVKNNAGLIGKKRLQLMAQVVETNLRHGKNKTTASEIEMLEAELNNTLEEINSTPS